MVNVKPILEAARPALDYLKKIVKEYGEQTLQDIKSGKLDVREKLAHLAYPELAKADIKTIDVDYLTKDKLVQTLKENPVEGSDEVAAILRKGKTHIYLYTAYLCKKELIPVEVNKYLIFVADAIARDLETLFDGKEIIILR